MTILEIIGGLLGDKAKEEYKENTDVASGENIATNNDNANKTDSNNSDNMGTNDNAGVNNNVSNEVLNNNETNTDEKTISKNKSIIENKESGDNMDIFENGWYNETTGAVDTSKIKNADVAAAIEMINNKATQEREARAFVDALRVELSNDYKAVVGEDTILPLLDRSKLKYTEGKVEGLKEELDRLKAKEPGLFKNKDKETNPLSEGFNPVTKKNHKPNSFTEAFRLMDELN